jgi:hypothetical protein
MRAQHWPQQLFGLVGAGGVAIQAFFRPHRAKGASAYHTSFGLSVYCSTRYKGIIHPSDEGLGRSRGGLTTKFHLACDGKRRPLSSLITAGQRHDSA